MSRHHVETPPKLAAMQYRVVRPLGTGAGSTILLISHDAAGAKKYALKVVKRHSSDDDVFIDQARHEFEVVQRFNHPFIVRIHDCVVRRPLLKVTGVELLMEYLDGPSLDNYKEAFRAEEGQDSEASHPRLVRRLVAYCSNVAAALAHMHRRGVFHGDLKPSNIMTSSDKSIRVIDFGTAWVRGQDKNRVQGTPQYMAPEQAVARVVNERTDIYTLGATMYRLFTDDYANLDVPSALPLAYRNRRPARAYDPTLPRKLDELIAACLEHEPEKRPEHAHEVQAALLDVAQRLGVTVKRT